jgi:hypothetical protein
MTSPCLDEEIVTILQAMSQSAIKSLIEQEDPIGKVPRGQNWTSCPKRGQLSRGVIGRIRPAQTHWSR